MIVLTVERIRNMISDCYSENEIIFTLRKHKVKCSFSTDSGFFHIRIPCKKGFIRIYRTCSRSCPFLVSSVPAVPLRYPVPALSNNQY